MMESTHQSKPQSYALFNDGVEVRRLELPGHKKQQLPSRHPADPLGRRTLYAGKPWALLDPAVRSVSKAAHDSALASGFPQWIADLLLQLTQEAMIAGRSHAEALFMASVAADMLNRGWRLDVTLAAANEAADLLATRYSAGAAFAGEDELDELRMAIDEQKRLGCDTSDAERTLHEAAERKRLVDERAWAERTERFRTEAQARVKEEVEARQGKGHTRTDEIEQLVGVIAKARAVGLPFEATADAVQRLEELRDAELAEEAAADELERTLESLGEGNPAEECVAVRRAVEAAKKLGLETTDAERRVEEVEQRLREAEEMKRRAHEALAKQLASVGSVGSLASVGSVGKSEPSSSTFGFSLPFASIGSTPTAEPTTVDPAAMQRDIDVLKKAIKEAKRLGLSTSDAEQRLRTLEVSKAEAEDESLRTAAEEHAREELAMAEKAVADRERRAKQLQQRRGAFIKGVAERSNLEQELVQVVSVVPAEAAMHEGMQVLVEMLIWRAVAARPSSGTEIVNAALAAALERLRSNFTAAELEELGLPLTGPSFVRAVQAASTEELSNAIGVAVLSAYGETTLRMVAMLKDPSGKVGAAGAPPPPTPAGPLDFGFAGDDDDDVGQRATMDKLRVAIEKAKKAGLEQHPAARDAQKKLGELEDRRHQKARERKARDEARRRPELEDAGAGVGAGADAGGCGGSGGGSTPLDKTMGRGMSCGDASGGSASVGGTSTVPMATYAAKAAAKAAAAAIAAGKDRAEAARLAHEAARMAYGLGSVEELNDPSFRGGGGGRKQRGEQASVPKGKSAAPYSGVGSGAMPGPSKGQGPGDTGARLEAAAEPDSLTTKDLNDRIARFTYRKARSGLTPSDQEELSQLVVERERRRTDVDLDDRIAALERKAIALEGQEIGPEEAQGGLTASSAEESGPSIVEGASGSGTTVGGPSGGGTTPKASPTKANGLLRGISKGFLFAARLSKGLSPAEQKEVRDLNAEKQLRKLRLAHGDERLPGPRKGPYAALGDKHLEDRISALELKAAPDGPMPKELEELRVEHNRRLSDRELSDKITRLERRKDTDGLSPKEQTELEGMHAERYGRLSDRELDERIAALDRKKVRMALAPKEQSDLDELNVEKNRRRSHRNLDDLIAALEHKKERGGLTPEVQKEIEELHAEKQARRLLQGDRDGASREAAAALSPSSQRFLPGSRPGSEAVGAAAREMLRERGFPASLAEAAADKARELMQQGLSPGAVIAGGLALGEALDAGQSRQSANVAAYAAAKAADAEADKDPRVAAMMASGNSLPHLLEHSLARGRAAAKRSSAGLDDHGFGGDNSSVVRFLRERDLPLEIARAGAQKAIDLFNQGFLPGAAFIGSVMYAEGLDDGLPPHSAEQGALAAARAAEAEAKRDRGVRTALRNNDVPSRVLELGLHAGHVAGQRSNLGADRFSVGGASDVGQKVTNELQRLRGSKVGERDATMITAVTLPPDDVAKAAADKAYQMIDEGYSAGTAFAAGLALGTALDAGRRPPDAALAAVAAAKAAEDAGASSAFVKAALEAGELPRALLERALTAGREAGMSDGREARREGTEPHGNEPRYGHACGADEAHQATSADDPGLDDPSRQGLEGASPVRAIDRARELAVKEHMSQERRRELKVEAQEIEVECSLM
ncbi:hypothetical protein Ctob_002273 [Chrysochromulina tobinii]|uniref:Uncharacterized protein n=1 Tax=Chrysochromulina tobinii TaxID=1460289 RepID=A0A0M0J7P5_9EUKA|nr:hypothetical protein Ctob_002273 [Chrysochromulina tobinii]|eukprot:KOO22372.1 hypothetical protein Ctob_002273 [Chrysochromulina sp. CCMP291]